jgi:hypothetical protein
MPQDETIGEGAISTARAFLSQQHNAPCRVAPTRIIGVTIDSVNGDRLTGARCEGAPTR